MKVSYNLEYDTEEYGRIHETLQLLISSGKDVINSLAQLNHTRELSKQQRTDARHAAELAAEQNAEGLSDNEIKVAEMSLELQELRQELSALSLMLLDEDSSEDDDHDEAHLPADYEEE